MARRPSRPVRPMRFRMAVAREIRRETVTITPGWTTFPSIEGGKTAGDTITLHVGRARGAATIRYDAMLLRGQSAVVDPVSDAQTYQTGEADIGPGLVLFVQAVDAATEAVLLEFTTPIHGAITARAPAWSGTPAISGGPSLGATFTATDATLSPGIPEANPLTIWQRWTGSAWADIAGETGATLSGSVTAGFTAGDRLRRRNHAANAAGTAEVVSNEITLTSTPAVADISRPLGDVVAGEEVTVAATFANIPSVWAQKVLGGSPEGSRVEIATSGGTAALTFSTAGAGRVQAWTASSGGTMLDETDPFPILSGTEAIAITTIPQAAYQPAAVVAFAGTYAGTWTGGTIQVHDSGDSPVGSPVTITGAADGAWGPTNITLPDTEDTGWYVKAVHTGGAVDADSGPFDTVAAAASTLATMAFEAFGSSADSNITFFGFAFAQGAVQPSDNLLIRSVTGNAERRMQWEPVSTWPDGSVCAMRGWAELPAIADATRHDVLLRLGETHSSPGSNLDLATVLFGRTAVVEIWAPGGGSAAASFDVLGAIGAHRHTVGPLVLGGRVEARAGVDIAASAFGGVESVRLVADWWRTKDGMLKLTVRFGNDRVPYTSVDQTGGGYATCGDATFGFRVLLDGVVVYDQRPSSGPNTILKQYCDWVITVGRKTTGEVYESTIHTGMRLTPRLIPDMEKLAESEVERPWQNWTPLRTGITTPLANAVSGSVGQDANPYHPCDLNRASGAVGGRPELGHLTAASAAWLAHGHRDAIRLVHRHVRAAAARATHWFDWESNLWIAPDTFPRFTIATGAGTSAPGTPKSVATSTPQQPHSDFTNYITAQLDHEGSFFRLPALLTGEPWLYDQVLAQASWAQLYVSTRWNGTSELYSTSPSWRGQTPDPDTGIAIAPVLGGGGNQTRTISWGLNMMAGAALLCPDDYPGVTMMRNLVKGWMAGLNNQAPLFEAVHGTEIGFPIVHSLSTGGRQSPQYQNNMGVQQVVKILRSGIGGPSAVAWAEKWLRWVVSWIDEPNDGLHRFHMRGSSKAFSADAATPGTATSWADVAAKSDAWLGFPNEAWTINQGERAYNADGVACLIPIRDLIGIIDPLLVRQALDGAVRCASERSSIQTGDQYPELDAFYFLSTNYANNNGVASRWGVYVNNAEAPVIVPGQSFSLSPTAQDGTIVGFVRTTGALPRNSAAGYANGDAFVIDDQPVGNPYRITMGGAIVVDSAADIPTDAHTIDVYCRTFDQYSTLDANTERRSATVTIDLVPVAVAPVIVAAGPFDVPTNAPAGTVVHTVSYSNSPTLPVTVTEVGGDTSDYFEVVGAEIRTKAAISTATPPEAISYQVQATNAAIGGGADTETFTINVVAAASPPAVANQTLEIAEGVDVGADATPDIVNTGGAATGGSIDSGNSAGRWSFVAPDKLRTAGRIARGEVLQDVLGMTFTNAAPGGSDTATITVNMIQADWVYTLTSTIALLAASAARRLRDDFSGIAHRVTRLSDNAQRDVRFDPSTGDLDVSETFHITTGEAQGQGLLAWVGAGDAVAVTNDQSAMAQGLATAAPAGAPFIVQSGTLCTRGGKPTFRFTGGRGMTWSSFRTGGAVGVASLVAAHRNAAAEASLTILAVAVNDSMSAAAAVTTSYLKRRNNFASRLELMRNGSTNALTASNAFTDGAFKIITGTAINETNRARAIAHNGTFTNAADITHTAMNATAYVTWGHRALGGPLGWEGDMPEMLFTADLDLTTDEGVIRGNMASYYGIS